MQIKFAKSLRTVGLGCVLSWGVVVPAHSTEVSDGVTSVTVEDIRKELETAPPSVRGMMSKTQMERFVANMLTDRRLEAASRKAGLAETEAVKAQLVRAQREVLVKAYIDKRLAEAIASLPDLEPLARERYEASRASYVEPEAIRAAHILFMVDDGDEMRTAKVVKEKADAVLEKLRGGADFAVLAKEYSADPGSNTKGGELPGWQNKGRLVPQFEAAAYALKPGELSEPVRTRFGYHIIKLLAHREAVQQPFDAVKEQILAQLRTELMGQKKEEFLREFQGARPVTIDDATLQALRKD